MISIPFPGNKKYSLKNVEKIVKEGGYKRSYEIFGGSCVLSANLYNDELIKEVHINDYDHLFDKYEEFLDVKDWLVNKCFDAGMLNRIHPNGKRIETRRFARLKDKSRVPIDPKDVRISEKEIRTLQKFVRRIDPKWYQMLGWGSNFVHPGRASGGTVKVNDFRMFDSYVYTDKQRAYLEVIRKLDRDCLDYKEYLNKYKDGFDEDTIIIADPPYVNTSQEQYQGDFTLDDTIILLQLLVDTGCDFLFFNSDEELVEKLLTDLNLPNYEIYTVGSPHNTSNKKRREVMAYVKRGNV